jgi:hypothetical protein
MQWLEAKTEVKIRVAVNKFDGSFDAIALN